ncbi:MAG TPA: type II toxin-antitoxin system VapC family toxin [Candidatus Saccharimonadales bacterium]|jgi:tRNA(fMet)-specific endonuclease VapC
MRLALDTNAYTAFQRGQAAGLKQLIDTAELIVLPFIVEAELRAGFKKGSREPENHAKLSKFMSSNRVLVLWADEATNEIYARIWAELSAIGALIPTNDIWIAAICLQNNLALATADTHFKKVPFIATVSADS